MDALEALRTRRSHGRVTEPGPSDDDLRAILEAGAAAPDHGDLRPFRFILLRGDARGAFGELLEEAYLRRCAEAGDEPVPAKAEKERTKVGRAPLAIVVAAVRQPSTKISWLDQRDAAAAAAENLLIAAHALGYGAIWRTGDQCRDEFVKKTLGLTPDDAIVGIVYVGTPHETKPPREIDLDDFVSEFEA